MSVRTPFRGSSSRGGGRRSFSDHRDPIVSGDSHFKSVRDANFSLQNRHEGTNSSNNSDYRSVYYSYDNQNQMNRRGSNSNSNANSNNNGGYGFDPQVQSYRPRAPFHGRPNQRPKPADFRIWEFAKHPPPPNSERFVVLSYNILADYLANNHRALYWHIPRCFMSWDWRKRNILFELGLWSADIMCFQEVDKFHVLEEDLKYRGYCGIWKMRTGEPIDGCAIFWRASRFKLAYDECIEFSKLGMRDNVAQVCVLESLIRNQTDTKSTLSGSLESPNRVVVCNIHVLYNPRRGEIKLGQVRVLLEKAQAVSKKWDAPVVLCGDFNCVPKSPLYDFISKQKQLDVSGIDRDKVSGQATAEILLPPRQFGRQDKGLSADSVINPATNLNDSFDRKEIYYPEKQDAASVSTDNLNEGDGSHVDKTTHDILCAESSDQLDSVTMQDPELTSLNSIEKDVSYGSPSEGHALKACVTTEELEESRDNYNSNCLPSNLSNVSCSESLVVDTSCMPSDLGGVIANPAQTCVDKPSERNGSLAFTNLDEKLAGLSLGEIDETLEDTRDLGEDAEKMPELNDEGDALPSDLGKTMGPSGIVHLGNILKLCLPVSWDFLGEAVLEDLLSSTSESQTVGVDEPPYDPSRWTSMEIATATGDANNTVLEHSLKLRSTYTEVEDRSRTRDSIGEPLVTSYNSRFMGTVDYIWRSEGLSTVKALAPIPKNIMQPSGGFPTKKWGSDHIALATELAFTK